jgi:hypothetical protein
MELTDEHLEAIRKTVREVDYGSVTINISAKSNALDLSIQKRVRYGEDTGGEFGSNIAGNVIKKKLRKKA